MTLLDAVPLVGVQAPTHRLTPPRANSYAADETIGLAESVGLDLDPWQMVAIVTALGEQAGGGWSAFEVGVEVPRQNGKGGILEARELAGLFLFGERLILHSAHEFKTAAEAFRRLRFWIDNSDDLRRRVKRVTTAAGNEGIELLNGARIRFVARSRGSGRGFTGDLIVFDEAMILNEQAIASMLPALSAVPNPQVWYTGSAPFHDSTVWHRVRGRALDAIRSGDRSQRLAWCGWEASPDDPIDDRAVWARTNPALGIRISAEHIEAERDAMDPETFARERLGVAELPHVGDGGPFDLVRWQSLVSADPVEGPLTVGVDVSPNLEHAAVGVAGVAGGVRAVEVIESRAGTEWVTDRVDRLLHAHADIATLVVDPRSPAGGLVNDLRVACTVAGVELVEVSTSDLVRAVGAIMQRVAAGALAHRGQSDLDSAVRAARLRSLGDAVAFSRRSSADNIAPLVAVTLALGVADDRAAEPEAPPMMDLAEMVQVI